MAEESVQSVGVHIGLVGKEQAPLLSANVVSVWVSPLHTTMYLAFIYPEQRKEAGEQVQAQCVATVALPHSVALELGRVLERVKPAILKAIADTPAQVGPGASEETDWRVAAGGAPTRSGG